MSESQQAGERVLWIDTLRALAALGVVVLHSSGSALRVPGTIPALDWWVANFGSAVGRYSVPIFLMLSGALLLPREEAASSLLRRRLGKLIPPFVIWSLAYGTHAFLTQADTAAGIPSVARWIAGHAVYGTAYHLWYVYVLFGLYLVMPVLGRWARAASDREILYFLALWAATLVFKIPGLSYYTLPVDLSVVSGYAGYLVLGYFLQRRLIAQAPQHRPIALGAGLALGGLVATLIGAFFWMRFKNEVTDAFYHRLTPNVMLYATGLFILIPALPIRAAWLRATCSFLAGNSYGIYLSHVAVLMAFEHISLFSDLPLLLRLPLTAAACLAVSTTLVALLRKAPLGKYLVG